MNHGEREALARECRRAAMLAIASHQSADPVEVDDAVEEAIGRVLAGRLGFAMAAEPRDTSLHGCGAPMWVCDRIGCAAVLELIGSEPAARCFRALEEIIDVVPHAAGCTNEECAGICADRIAREGLGLPPQPCEGALSEPGRAVELLRDVSLGCICHVTNPDRCWNCRRVVFLDGLDAATKTKEG